MSEELSEEDKQIVDEYLRNRTDNSASNNSPMPEEKHNVHLFLHKVATADDTTKLGNLGSEEVGMPRLTLRAYKDLSLIADTIMDNKFISKYYKDNAEILTSTSLSKDAKLVSLAVLQKRQIEDVTKPKKENRGWFKKEENNQQNETS